MKNNNNYSDPFLFKYIDIEIIAFDLKTNNSVKVIESTFYNTSHLKIMGNHKPISKIQIETKEYDTKQ